jgi:mRNA-degrading endonuclease RelE of RelBE toxin-antitoxin system
LVDVDGIPTAAGPSAEGFVAYGQIVNIVDETARQCIVGLVASVAADHVLSGTATMSATVNPGGQVATVSAALSGDVSATTPIVISGSSSFGGTPTFTASGAASKTTKVPAKTVKDVKTKAQKKAAKKKYAKKLASLKKSYAKALKKAGSSKSKKAAAKKAYATKKRAAKAAYRYAVADYKIVKKASTSTEVLPFNIALLTL